MDTMTRPTAGRSARALGGLSIALGAAELAGAGRLLGLMGGRRTGVTRLYGLREIATGVGLLRATDPTPWVWGRVGGDVLDAVSLVGRLRRGVPGKGYRIAALLVVGAVGAVDLGCALAMRPRRKG